MQWLAFLMLSAVFLSTVFIIVRLQSESFSLMLLTLVFQTLLKILRRLWEMGRG